MGRKKNWISVQFFQIESFADSFIFIDPRNKSQTRFLQVYLANRINESDCTNLEIPM